MIINWLKSNRKPVVIQVNLIGGIVPLKTNAVGGMFHDQGA